MNVPAVMLWMLLGEVVLLATLMGLPVMHGERAFFSVRVAPETYRGEGRRILHRYWWTLLAIYVLLAALCYLVAARFHVWLVAGVCWLVTSAAAGLITYGSFAHSMRPFAVPSTTTRFASSLRTRSLADYTRPWLEVGVALLSVAPIVVLTYYYPRMPERMPVHWNIMGQPDRWAQKSFAAVFFLPLLGIYMQGIFLLAKHDLAQAKMILPAAHTEEFLHGKEASLRANMQLTDWVRAVIALLFGCIMFLSVTTSVETLRRLAPVANILIWVSTALLLSGIFYFMWRMMKINEELIATTGECYVQRPADEEHWRHGGLTYYNPDDPALIVEKLGGLGYTINMAHPGIYARVASLAGVPLFIVWALLSL